MRALPRRSDPCFWDQSNGRRRGWLALVLVTLFWFALVLGREAWPASSTYSSSLEHLLCDNFWTVYDPTEMTLDDRRQPIFPPDEYSIENDLYLIKLSGINGIYISTSNDIMAQVPRLAKAKDIKVIL